MTSSSLSHSLSQPMSASHVAEWQQISEVVEKQNAFIERFDYSSHSVVLREC